MAAASTLVLIIEPRPSHVQRREWAAALYEASQSRTSIVPVLVDGAQAPVGLQPRHPITVPDATEVDDELIKAILAGGTRAPAEPRSSRDLAARLDLIGSIVAPGGRSAGSAVAPT
jgi:hypothetical protein